MMRIALTYDLREDYLALGWGEHEVAEFDRADTIDAIEAALAALAHTVDRVGGATRLMRRLASGDRWDLVFNICESVRGTGREALVPALLDHAGVPYTFGDPLTCAVTLDKPITKRVLRDHGLPTPDFAVVEHLAEVDTVPLPLPLFAKPAREGSSKGIEADCLARTPATLRAVCGRLLERFRQPVLLETFLPGREVTVGIVGTGPEASVAGVLGVGMSDADAVYGYDTKERCEELVEYRLVDGAFADRCGELALAAYRALGCRDAGRVDLRSDAAGAPHIIEINCLPGLHPTHSDLPIMATLAGLSYRELIARIVRSASARVGPSATIGAEPAWRS